MHFFMDDVRFQPGIVKALFYEFKIIVEWWDSIEKLAKSTDARTSCLLSFDAKAFLSFRSNNMLLFLILRFTFWVFVYGQGFNLSLKRQRSLLR